MSTVQVEMTQLKLRKPSRATAETDLTPCPKTAVTTAQD